METPREFDAIGFNGLGQIGSAAFRQYLRLPPEKRSDLTVINEWERLEQMEFYKKMEELLPEGARLGGMPNDHSVHVIFKDGKDLVVSLFNWKEPEDMRWREEGVQSVIDASRKPSLTAPEMVNLGKAEEVLMTGPSTDFPEVLRGINENVVTLNTPVLSNGSCTTKACAPVLKKLLTACASGKLPPIDSIGITGTHAATNTDSFVGTLKEPAMAYNLVASGTGSIGALQRIFMEQLEKNRIFVFGNVIRVPISEGSIVNLTVTFQELPPWSRISKMSPDCGCIDENTIRRAVTDPLKLHAFISGILETEEPKDSSLFGFDHDAQPQLRKHANDTRSSVVLSKLISGEGRTIVIPIRYNNVLASGNEAVLTMQRIRAIRSALAASLAENRALAEGLRQEPKW